MLCFLETPIFETHPFALLSTNFGLVLGSSSGNHAELHLHSLCYRYQVVKLVLFECCFHLQAQI